MAEFPVLAAGIGIPVRYVLGDHERWWRPDRDELEAVRSSFTSARRVVVERQFLAGHNLSRGLSATAYHLKLLAFVEECLLDRDRQTAVSDGSAS